MDTNSVRIYVGFFTEASEYYQIPFVVFLVTLCIAKGVLSLPTQLQR
jgi:hypothetical protein